MPKSSSVGPLLEVYKTHFHPEFKGIKVCPPDPRLMGSEEHARHTLPEWKYGRDGRRPSLDYYEGSSNS